MCTANTLDGMRKNSQPPSDYFYLTVRCVKGVTTSYIVEGIVVCNRPHSCISTVNVIPASLQSGDKAAQVSTPDTMVLACDACDG
jgi:hypothetical protein